MAKPSWKDCWKGCARPLPDGSRPARDGKAICGPSRRKVLRGVPTQLQVSTRLNAVALVSCDPVERDNIMNGWRARGLVYIVMVLACAVYSTTLESAQKPDSIGEWPRLHWRLLGSQSSYCSGRQSVCDGRPANTRETFSTRTDGTSGTGSPKIQGRWRRRHLCDSS